MIGHVLHGADDEHAEAFGIAIVSEPSSWARHKFLSFF
jgi:hypothetical protein